MNVTELSSLDVLVGIAITSQRGVLPQPPSMPDKGCLENTVREKQAWDPRGISSELSSHVGQVFWWLAPIASNSLIITT